jgi:hypothetical protein
MSVYQDECAAFWAEVREAAKEYAKQFAEEEEEIHPHAKRHVYEIGVHRSVRKILVARRERG